MWLRIQLTIIMIVFSLPTSIARAGDLTAFNAGVERVAVHYRLAASYLRTGNADLGGLEVDNVYRAWIEFIKLVRVKTPDAFEDNPLFSPTLQQISYHTEKARGYVDGGNLTAAEQEMNSIRGALYKLRRASGLYLLPDCLLEASRALDALFVYQTAPPNWYEQAVGAAVQSRAAAYDYALRQCDQMASKDIKDDPEFRRLIDGATASLSLIPKAIHDRDSGLLHRVLIEVRSFDNLLFFRFG